MLLSFRVSNWRSIRDEVAVDLYSGKRRRNGDAWPRPDVATVAAVYGANAAGKSALIKAMQFVGQAVRASFRDWGDKRDVPRQAFALDPAYATKPSHFEVEFVASDGYEYQYGFSVDDREVLEEYLYQYKTHRRTRLFARERGEYEFGASVLGPKAQLTTITRRNSLFLSSAASAEALSVMEAAHTWLAEEFWVFQERGHEAVQRTLASMLESDSDRVRRVMAFVRAADLGVSDVSVHTRKLDPEHEQRIRSILKDSPIDVAEFIAEQEKQLTFTHRGAKGDVTLPLDEQSAGSQALLSIALVLVNALEIGATCVFDEIDSSLHPHLVAELVEVFKDPLINRKQAQLIFTSHDVSLLRGGATRALDREEVWFAEKSVAGVSTLTALSEYKGRSDENWERNYLAGKYGATPVLAIRERLRRVLAEDEQLFSFVEED